MDLGTMTSYSEFQCLGGCMSHTSASSIDKRKKLHDQCRD